MRAHFHRAVIVAFACAAGSAWADHTINVDGSNSDWSGISTCIPEPSSDGQGGVDLDRTCVTNDNASGDQGKLYMLFEATKNFPNQNLYIGFAIDLDNDGMITSGHDEVYAVYYQNKNSPVLQVFDAQTYTYKRQYTSKSSCGGTSTSDGWSEKKSGQVAEFGISYGCLRFNASGSGRQYGSDIGPFMMGVYPNFDLTDEVYYDGTADVLVTSATPAIYPALTARSGQVRLFWTNPVDHAGTLIVRSEVPFTTFDFVPSNGTAYTQGDTIQRLDLSHWPWTVREFKIVFAEHQGQSTSFTDTTVTDGTRYYYKVFNHRAGYIYASGDTPVPGGLFAEPRSSTSGGPLWCYSSSFTSLQQPLVEAGAGVFTSGNGGVLLGLRTAPGQANDGDELFRPTSLGGAIQARFPIVPLHGRSGKYILTGTQNGTVAAVNTATGVPLWKVPGSTFGGNQVLSYVSAQLYDYTNPNIPAGAAFRAANPGRDLIFVPTRVSGTSNTYKVVALSGVDGSVVWQSGNMSPILGGITVDYPTNRLYVPTATNSSGSLKILSSLTGAQVGTLSVGSVKYGVVKANDGTPSGELVVVNDSGTAYGFNLGWTTSPPAPSWSGSIGGAPVSFPLPVPSGFLVATSSAVKRFAISGTKATQVWSRSVTNSSGPWLHYQNEYVWVGSSDLKVHGITYASGTDNKTVTAPGSRPGMPNIDTTTNRLVVGLEDGRVCAFALP
ncbi:MAG: PQQ-binding-like beta-propeller repeat protein [Myxococcaceae bacterium]|nr:PQQ-binding-like beta-propeller repeat protein [Myxococcaceae bacterium]